MRERAFANMFAEELSNFKSQSDFVVKNSQLGSGSENLHYKAVSNEESDDDEDYFNSEEEKIGQYAVTNTSLDYDEKQTSVCEVLDAACDDDKGIINYLYYSQLSRAISIFFLPWTLPIELSLNFTKK